MTTLEDTPDLEELAAYVDGRLTGDRKARVEEQLLRDEDYYEVFMETVRFREEEIASEQSGSPKVVPWRRKGAVTSLLSAAAVLLTAIMTYQFWVVPLRPPPDDWLAEVDAESIAEHESFLQQGWQTFRGSEEAPSSAEALAYRVGVLSIDLQLAIMARDGTSANGLASHIAAHIENSDFAFVTGFETLSESFEELEEIRTEDIVPLLGKAQQTEDDFRASTLESSEKRFLDFGQWIEIGRLAALDQDAVLLRQAAQQAIRWTGTPVPEQTEVLEAIMAKSELSTSDYANAYEAFRGITRKLTKSTDSSYLDY
ncbi:MAG: hypothetical protein AAF560_12105 [Acidobacteriota bacterium]